MKRNRTWRRLRRILGLGAGLLVIALVAGAVFQRMSERKDLQLFPPPGKMVDVGGRHLHLYCTGIGSPTVVLIAGLGNDVNHWSSVQPSIAEFTRVCSYDRAGLGWSDPSSEPKSADRIVKDLETLLERAGEKPPYILAGHSNGGPYVRLYAAAQPENVAGLLLIDPNPENAPSCSGLPASSRLLYGSLVSLAPFGVPRLLLPVLFPLDSSPLSPEAKEKHAALRARTSAIEAVWAEQAEVCAMLEAVRNSDGLPPNIPIVLLSAGKRPAGATPGVEEMHKQTAEQLSAIDFTVVEDAGHWIQLDRPDLVISRVKLLTEKAREHVR